MKYKALSHDCQCGLTSWASLSLAEWMTVHMHTNCAYRRTLYMCASMLHVLCVCKRPLVFHTLHLSLSAIV